MKKKIILIGGGVGPMAGLELHRLILENTNAKKDQDHLRVIHMSCSDMIEDRTDSLLQGHPEKPAESMANVILAGSIVAEKLNMPVVAGIPCNTFHASQIWTKFTEKLSSIGFTYPVLNMVEETILHISKNYKYARNIGVLSTTGTRKFEIYSAPLEKHGFNVLKVENQEKTHQLIYDPDWGIKANPTVSEKSKLILSEQIMELNKMGADLIILGCTELPLAVETSLYKKIRLIDPMNILAYNLVSMAINSK